ncbi:MAG: hypothetical protein V1873_00730 [Verrucomicrobiota bacterium]
MIEHLHSVPAGSTPLNLLGVDYAHLKTGDGGDLYVTRLGVPFLEHLKPESWYERAWFERNRERLSGTSTVYRVRTKPVGGRGKDLVVKWCRVGEQVPFDTFTLNKFVEAEFNSPYEEFALVMEMRQDPSPGIVRTHKPLAIYVPAERMKAWQTSRSQTKIELKKAKYRDVELDIYRQYILIYEWVKGVSATEAFPQALPTEKRKAELARLTGRVTGDLARKGFRVLDMKPEHFIVRPQPDGAILRDPHGEIAYALVDFELLERTPEHEQAVVAGRRATYLQHQKDRFAAAPAAGLPEHLRATQVLGVDYVYGHSESTQGRLWVVGRDPALFDYFLPERWRRTKRLRLSEANQVYQTRTKDNINLVWKVSRVGEKPDVNPDDDRGRSIAGYGYNSPFEEFALAFEISRRGFPATYPRAVYMTGQEADAPAYTQDSRRYESHAAMQTPDGSPILRPDHNYITVWGYWNGLDEVLARQDVPICRPLSLNQALREGVITEQQFRDLMARARRQLAELGFEDLNPEGSHFLLSLTPQNELIRDADGTPTLRLCNFGLVRRL